LETHPHLLEVVSCMAIELDYDEVLSSPESRVYFGVESFSHGSHDDFYVPFLPKVVFGN
jgi:hypothetical protein